MVSFKQILDCWGREKQTSERGQALKNLWDKNCPFISHALWRMECQTCIRANLWPELVPIHCLHYYAPKPWCIHLIVLVLHKCCFFGKATTERILGAGPLDSNILTIWPHYKKSMGRKTEEGGGSNYFSNHSPVSSQENNHNNRGAGE